MVPRTDVVLVCASIGTTERRNTNSADLSDRMGTASKKDNNIQSGRRFPVCCDETCRDKPRKQTTWSGKKTFQRRKVCGRGLIIAHPLPGGKRAGTKSTFFYVRPGFALRAFFVRRALIYVFYCYPTRRIDDGR